MIVIRDFDTQLTAVGFFNVFEQFYAQSRTMEDAYDKVINYCLDNKISFGYSSFNSFQKNYYSFLKKKSNRKLP